MIVCVCVCVPLHVRAARARAHHERAPARADVASARGRASRVAPASHLLQTHTHTHTRTHALTHTAAAHPQDDGNSRSAKIIARRLAREGYGKAYVLGGGFGEWKRASLRTREVTKVFVETVAAPKLAGTISGGRTVRGFLE